MKFKNNEFRIDAAQPIDAALDFQTLCALLAAYQAETPTARLAREGFSVFDQPDHGNPAVAVLLGVQGHDVAGTGPFGSFHAAAAARFKGEDR